MNPLLLVAVSLFGYMTSWFVVSIIIKRNDIADVAWGLGFVFVAWLSFFISGFSIGALLVNILVTIWGLRLGAHIYKRNAGKDEDSRYLAWRKTWKNFYVRSFFQVYMLQGVFLYLIALPVIHINQSQSDVLGVLELVGLCIWGIGFYFEVVGDKQLKEFIANPLHKGKLMDRGLWQYSRHPNYFGEVTLWWGIFVFAVSLPYGFYTIVGPLTITLLILYVSGIPLLEKKYEGRPDWEAYTQKTSMFFPLPPKI